jgi:NAD(P)-dependent dehydrogenase (short-subunit alcohol dehydrogenase family)
MDNAFLKDKVCVVTGGGRGIGRDIALAMAATGAAVVVNDLGSDETGVGADASPAHRVAEEIKAAGGRAAASTDSVSGWESARRIVQTAVETFGRVDCVVNNAGILRDAIFHKMTEAEFDAVIAVHLKGSFCVARAAAEHFRAQNSGSMIHMTSNSGLVGNFGQANYAAAKMGIVGLSKSIALDMKRFGVRSNCISPSAWSRLTGTVPSETEDQKIRLARIKQMTPAKIAPVAVFLASDQATDVTGQIFAVRHNEIFLMSQSRPVRSVQRSEGWTPETVAEYAMPALRGSFFPLHRSADVFCWDPV